MFDNKFNIKNTLEAEKEKLELEKNAENNIKKKRNNSKNGIKNLVDLYLKNQGIKYNDWLAEKHQELINEMIEKNILTIKKGE